MSDSSDGSCSQKLSRRKFLAGSSATVAGVAVATSGISLLSERAEAFFNVGAFWKKPVGNGQTSNGYSIGQSLRIRTANSAYLTRTPSVSGNRQTWTFSCWIKMHLGTNHAHIFDSRDDGNNKCLIAIWNDAGGRNLEIDMATGGTQTCHLVTNATFRDPSAWYHLVIQLDTTQAVDSDRAKIYINGTRQTSWNTSSYAVVWPNQNADLWMNQANKLHAFGYMPGSGAGPYSDFYLSEVYFIDGQALDASYFGQLDTSSGQWIPKAYSGTYGTNGFYLKFADNSDSTAATLGKDSAALGGAHALANNWTPNGFATHDQVLDSPTNNFCTLSPLVRINTASCTLSAGGLTASISASGADTAYGGMFAPSGKWYWEVTAVSSSGTNTLFTGIRAGSEKYPFGAPSYSQYGGDYSYYPNGGVIDYNDGPSWIQTGLPTAGNGANIGVALDVSGSTVTFYLNGTKVGSTQSIQARSDWTAYAQSMSSTSNVATWNFGQGGQTGLIYDAASGGRFKYTPPAGFKALCTANLPSTMPVVTSGTFTGNASADGPFVWLGGAPTDLTINGNTVTWGTHADKLANGFKVRTSSASYNASGSNSFSATVPVKFKWATGRTNP
jgi:hypothetical protein